MKKITMGTSAKYITGLALFGAIGLTPALAYVQLTGQVGLGSSNANVTNLQEFLASDPDVYPSGLVTGYFGSLTAAAVSRFQAKYGLDQVGRVGPLTLAKINSLISGNSGGNVGDSSSAPAVRLTSMPTMTGTTAVLNWNTSNEIALGRVYYSTSPLQMNEGDMSSNGFAVTSGTLAAYDSTARSNQSTTITGLMPNTTYYYTIVATDLSGNVSVVGPNNTFRTNSQ